MQGRYQNVHRDENNTTIRSGVIREDLRLSRYRDRRRATRGGAAERAKTRARLSSPAAFSRRKSRGADFPLSRHDRRIC